MFTHTKSRGKEREIFVIDIIPNRIYSARATGNSCLSFDQNKLGYNGDSSKSISYKIAEFVSNEKYMFNMYSFVNNTRTSKVILSPAFNFSPT